MSEISIKENLINDDYDQSPLEKQVIDKKPIKKERKPKTPAQLEQFEKVRLKRLDAIKEKKELQKIEASKLLLNNGYVKKEDLPAKETIEPIKQVFTPHINDDAQASLSFKVGQSPYLKLDKTEDEESDDQVIVVKKKKKPKKKTIIIEESDEEDEEEPEIIYNKVKKTRDFITQQNKKSVLKIHRPHDYFI
jgi:hypothetical protein